MIAGLMGVVGLLVGLGLATYWARRDLPEVDRLAAAVRRLIQRDTAALPPFIRARQRWHVDTVDWDSRRVSVTVTSERPDHG